MHDTLCTEINCPAEIGEVSSRVIRFVGVSRLSLMHFSALPGTCAMAVSQWQLLSLIAKCNRQRCCVWHTWKSLGRVNSKGFCKCLCQNGRYSGVYASGT